MSVVTSVSDDGNQTIVIIKTSHRLVRGLLLATVLVLWVMGTLSFPYDFIAKGPRGFPGIAFVFLALVLLAWLAAGGLFIQELIWIIFGAVVVSIRDIDLTTEYKVGPITIGKPKVFAVANIQCMRIEERSYKFKGKKTVKSAIIFDYLGTKRQLAARLSKQEAESLLKSALHKFVQN